MIDEGVLKDFESKKLLEYANEFRRINLEVAKAAKEQMEGQAKFLTRVFTKMDSPETFRRSALLGSWEKDSIKVLQKITFHLFNIASKESMPAKNRAIAGLSRDAGLSMNPFAVMPDERFNLLPAEHGIVKVVKNGKVIQFQVGPWKDEKNIEVWKLWHIVTTFGRHIAESPKRLKQCLYCEPPRLFWDGLTKTANMHFCGRQSCKRKYNLARKQKERRKK
jgi:hypothetical protein